MQPTGKANVQNFEKQLPNTVVKRPTNSVFFILMGSPGWFSAIV